MLTQCINAVPVQGRMNVIQAAIFNLNMRLVALARTQLAIANKDNSLFATPEGVMDEETAFSGPVGTKTFQFGKHIDGANTLDEQERAGEQSAAVSEEQGHDIPLTPIQQAEPFVALRDMLMLKYFDEANKSRRRPLDQSFAAVINWMHDREFIPNQNEAQSVYAASRGRVSLEQAIAAQKRRHEDERKRLAKIAEPLLKTMEDFHGLDLTVVAGTENLSEVDGDTMIDTLFNNMPAITRLGILNVMWRRCNKLVTDDFPSKRVPTQDFAADIALAIDAEDQFFAAANSVYESAHDDYAARKASGLPEYDVVRAIEAKKKSAAKAGAAPLAKPARAA